MSFSIMQFCYTMVHSLCISNFVQRQHHLLLLHYTKKQAYVCMQTNTPAPSHMLKNDISVSPHKENEELIMHKHNNFL